MDRIVKFLLSSLAHAPLALARFYTTLLDVAIPRLRRTAMRNLELAYPEKSLAERRAIASEVFGSIARLIWVFEKLHWVHDVRWPNPDRLSTRLLPEAAGPHRSTA